MKFRTEINIDKIPVPLHHDKPVVLLGSCFTDNIGNKLQKYLFHTALNPFGVIYNPESIRWAIMNIMQKDRYTEADLDYHKELWFSYDHYTLYSSTDKKLCLEKINKDLEHARSMLETAGHLLITFGTSYVYKLKSDHRVVSNCHKLPAQNFTRTRLSIEEIVSAWSQTLKDIFASFKNLQVIFTVSPVRHIKDGLVENQHSKAILQLAIEELCKLFEKRCSYFPAYEIMMDDLRDYRFYDTDLVHPSQQATDFIWDYFRESCIDPASLDLMQKLDPVLSALTHRSRHQDTIEYRKFIVETAQKRSTLEKEFPQLNWNILESK